MILRFTSSQVTTTTGGFSLWSVGHSTANGSSIVSAAFRQRVARSHVSLNHHRDGCYGIRQSARKNLHPFQNHRPGSLSTAWMCLFVAIRQKFGVSTGSAWRIGTSIYVYLRATITKQRVTRGTHGRPGGPEFPEQNILASKHSLFLESRRWTETPECQGWSFAVRGFLTGSYGSTLRTSRLRRIYIVTSPRIRVESRGRWRSFAHKSAECRDRPPRYFAGLTVEGHPRNIASDGRA